MHFQLMLPERPCADRGGDVAATGTAAPCWHTAAFNGWTTQMGAGDVVTDAAAASAFVSARFQWLPADILVGADGRIVFDPYVNNMDPERHAALYAASARLLERMVPQFERTLAASAQRPQCVVQIEPDCEDWWRPDVWTWWSMKDSGEAAEMFAEWRDSEGVDAQEGCGDEDLDHVYIEEIHELWEVRRQWVPPTLPDVFEPLPPPPVADLKRRRLQVIVKYAEIVLTLERPEYGGGVWHVEGMRNEAIVASCIAYLASDNSTESRLHFRCMVPDPSYAEYDAGGVRRMCGMEDDGGMNEPLGSARCVPGHMLCWPNAWQHRVAPFEISDPFRPEVRKFPAVFLVHPGERVLSTRDVPPQQMEWHDAESGLGSAMPEEVKRKVDGLREFLVTLERGKALRLEPMEERARAVQNTNHEVYGRGFSLCEH